MNPRLKRAYNLKLDTNIYYKVGLKNKSSKRWQSVRENDMCEHCCEKINKITKEES